MDYTTLFVSIGGWLVTLLGYILVDRREKQKQLDGFKKDIITTLGEHREEYLKGINDVQDNINSLQSSFAQSQTFIGLKIDALEKKQDAHNNVIQRVYALESKTEVQQEQINNLKEK